jgi:hypothetical protein
MEINNQLKVSGNGFKRNLTVAIQTSNRRGVNLAIQEFKLPTGAANYPALLSIPPSERLPAMALQNPKLADMIVTAGLTMALESMNFVRPMNEAQVMDLSMMVIETASEDNLALEDLILFLQNLVRGHYGSNYESMDIPKFMGKFEEYRQERHQSMMRIKEERDAQFKALPVNDRYSEILSDGEKRKHREAMIGELVEKATKHKE